MAPDETITITYDPTDLAGAKALIAQANKLWPGDGKKLAEDMDKRLFDAMPQ